MRIFVFWVACCMLLWVHPGAAQQLYPYKAGKLFGYCTMDKKMIIPPVYIFTEANYNFYLCMASSGVTVVYNRAANIIDSAAYMAVKMSSSKVLLLDPYNLRDMVTTLIAQQQKSNSRFGDWQVLSPAHGRTIDSLGNTTIINDTLVAIHAGHNLVKTRSGNKHGIYNISKQEYTVPMMYDSITIVPGKFYVGWLNGKGEAYLGDEKHFTIPFNPNTIKDIFDDGLLMETKAEKSPFSSLYDSKGNIICAPDKEWGRLIYPNMTTKALWIRIAKSTMTPENVLALYSAKGKFIKNVYSVKEWVNDLLLVTEVDKSGNGKIIHYLYNVVKNKWVPFYSYTYTPGGTPTEEFGMYLTIKYNDRRVYLNGYTGEPLFTMYDSVWSHQPVKQLMGHLSFTRFVNGVYCYLRNEYVRINLDGPLTFYDPEFNIISTLYDSISPLRILNDKFARVKKADKYGIINQETKEVIPAIYDQLEFKNSRYAKVTKQGRTYWIDTANNELFGGAAFDYISDYSVAGKWLAYTYKPAPENWRMNRYEYTEVAKAHLIDNKGTILATWDAGNEPNTAYMLTVNGKILRYPAPNTQATCGVKLYDPVNGKIDSLPYTYRDIKTYKEAAIIIQCINTDRETAIFSALDFSPVLAFSDYEEYSGLNVKEIDAEMPGKEAGIIFHASKPDYESDPESKKTHHTNHVKLTGGFYSVSGVKYWDEASER